MKVAMFDFLTASQNMPFTVALAVMLGMALLEGVASLLGAGISSFIDSLLPDFDINLELDTGDVPTVTPLSRLLGWLRFGQVPALILLVIFLTSFGLIGLGIQSFVNNLTGALLPGLMASAGALFLALPVVRTFGGAIARIIPKDETDAVEEKSLLGRVAVITLGSAKKGSSAEAKVKDKHGLTHYVMVEPDQDDAVYTSGTAVLLVKQDGSVFRVIENTNSSLVDEV